MSLDGYVAGPDQSEEHPLGVGRDVPLGGGASVVQQYLAAGLVDEFELYLVAVLLGDGERLLENVDDLNVEQVRVRGARLTYIKYRVVRCSSNPQGFLVAILEDADQAEQANATLAEAGFAQTDLRVYTSQQILDSWQRFQAERSLAQRVAGAFADDPDTIEQYFGYARAGRSALWVRVADKADADPVVRGLADHQVLHFRHYGHDRQDDLHIR